MHELLFHTSDTTDVQVVTAAIIKGVNTSIIQCQFIPGSTATGCMVVLTSEGQNTTYNLIRNKSINCSMLAVTIEHPSSHYHGVEAFDIESDGSIGSLPVPGQLINNSKTLCIFTSSNRKFNIISRTSINIVFTCCSYAQINNFCSDIIMDICHGCCTTCV